MGQFAELKARQAVSWGAPPFERIAETFADIHDRPSPWRTLIATAEASGSRASTY